MAPKQTLSTELRRVANLLETQETLLAKIERIASIGHWEWNIKENDLFWSDETYKIFRLTHEEFNETYDAFLDHVHPDDREKVENAVREALEDDIPYCIEHRIVGHNGEIIYVRESGEVTSENGIPSLMVGTIKDITQQKKHEEELKLLAFRDSGTNLYNKRFFEEQLGFLLNRSDRDNSAFGLLLIDLDDFKNINDCFGHVAGDLLIKEIASRIESVFPRKSDIVARWGGDEFTVLCFSDNKRIIKQKCDMLVKAIAVPIGIDGQVVEHSASVGLCYYDGTEKVTATKLIERADAAMYKAKSSGKNQYKVFK